MITLLVWLAVLVIVAVVGWWVLSQLPLPPPINQVVQIVFVVIVAVILILLLLQFAGVPTAPLLR